MNTLSNISKGLIALCIFAMTTSTFGQSDLARDNIVVILDASGSMSKGMLNTGKSKMETAKMALLKAMESIPTSTNVGVVVFSGMGLADRWPHPLGPLDRDKLAAAISQLGPNGDTPLGAYLKVAVDTLLEQRRKQRGYGTFRLMIVTDGQASDKRLVDQYLPDIFSRGITVDVIGVAMSQRHNLATRVHSYRSADDPHSLVQAVKTIVGEIGASADDSTNAEDFEYIAALPDGVAPLMLTALSTSGNHPIGTDPQRIVRTVSTQPTTKTQSPTPQSSTPQLPAPPLATTSTPDDDEGGVSIIGIIIVIGVVSLSFVKLLLGQSKRKRNPYR